MSERVWLFHPGTEQTFHCPADAAEGWKSRDWVDCEPPKEINPAVAEYVPMPRPSTPAVEASESPAVDKPKRGSKTEGKEEGE